MEIEQRKKKLSEDKRLSRRLKEFLPPPPGCMWEKAVSKNPDERQDGRDGLSLLFVLFEDTLKLKADHNSDPLEDLDRLLQDGSEKGQLIDEFAAPMWSKKGKPIANCF